MNIAKRHCKKGAGMKSKFEEVQKKYNAAQRQKAQLEAEIIELKERQPILSDEAEKRAEAGDLEGYIELKGQADRISAEIHVKELQLKKAAVPIEKDEAIAAWKEYIKPADAAFVKKFEAYKKARQELCTMLSDLARDRRNALELREMLLSYCGVNKGDTQPYVYREELANFPLQPIEVKDANEDCNFFQKSGMLTFNEAGGIRQLLYSFIS